jgi:hypothetical protein
MLEPVIRGLAWTAGDGLEQPGEPNEMIDMSF